MVADEIKLSRRSFLGFLGAVAAAPVLIKLGALETAEVAVTPILADAPAIASCAYGSLIIRGIQSHYARKHVISFTSFDSPGYEEFESVYEVAPSFTVDVLGTPTIEETVEAVNLWMADKKIGMRIDQWRGIAWEHSYDNHIGKTTKYTIEATELKRVGT